MNIIRNLLTAIAALCGIALTWASAFVTINPVPPSDVRRWSTAFILTGVVAVTAIVLQGLVAGFADKAAAKRLDDLRGLLQRHREDQRESFQAIATALRIETGPHRVLRQRMARVANEMLQFINTRANVYIDKRLFERWETREKREKLYDRKAWAAFRAQFEDRVKGIRDDLRTLGINDSILEWDWSHTRASGDMQFLAQRLAVLANRLPSTSGRETGGAA